MTEQTTKEFPQITISQITLLKKLSEACAVSGDEREVRGIIKDQLKDAPVDLTTDSLGNILVTRNGKGNHRLRVMVAAHMDEVGFMLTHDEGDGIYRFENVGSMNANIMVGKTVWIGSKHTPGIIGTKAIHLTTKDERKQGISKDDLRIDVGLGNKQTIKVGDRATFATSFQRNKHILRGKAMDDRVGIVTLIELVKNPPENIDLLAAFTVQEEVGLRGAYVAAYHFDPDLSLVLDCTPANDLPSWDERENTKYNTRLGSGPAIYVADRATLSDPRLIRHFIDTAQKLGIRVQFRQPGSGGTDAGAIHKQRAGIPSISVSVPARYIHSPASLIDLSDWKNLTRLVFGALSRLPADILKQDRA